MRRFIAFLVDRGLIVPLIMAATDAVDPRVADYQQWLTRHRGICESTAKRHGRMVMRLLVVLGGDPRTYDAALIRRTIVAEAQQCSPSHVKTMTTALRGYLRFLAAAGMYPPGLDRAVPLVPQWRLSSLPRYLSAADVERLIASCDLGTVHGMRDRAILLLLARLGLRVGDVRAVPPPSHAWSAWRYGGPGSSIRHRGAATFSVTRPRPPCCAAVRRFSLSEPCCGTVRSTRPRITRRSICRCSSRLHSLGRENGHADRRSRAARRAP